MLDTLLGTLTPQQFFDEYWQRKPLLVRQSVPGFTGIDGLADRQALFNLACQDEVESRLVVRDGPTWQMRSGPFSARDFRRRVGSRWTVLVQGVNLHITAADRLMRQFSFVPYARLDDLMVSYAVDGGGVGPHFDNYDVFLLQGIGRRRWRIGKQRDQSLIEGLPVRILRDFKPKYEWVLEPGDLLYLPPEWAHDGIAEGDCMTWSIGFRTAPAQELAEQFLIHLQDTVELHGRYADQGMRKQKHPAEIGEAMVDKVDAILSKIRWDRTTVRNFLGCYLTEPKFHVFFERPRRTLSPERFAESCQHRGIRLDSRTQMLFSGGDFFLNGLQYKATAKSRSALRRLADEREHSELPQLDAATATILYDWYCNGFLVLR